MKPISTLTVLNRKPTIVIDDYTFQSIRHLVSIAPEEAQWFHTVIPEFPKAQPDRVYLHLSQKLYIPKQTTSITQVDSSSSMMIEFYNELKQGCDNQETINNTLNSMTCWCHSHHNMAPNPSHQDVSQFNFFVNSSIEQKQSNWQVMLIFNKKDQFYSRVYDPTTDIVFEGVEIVKNHRYDFSYIDHAAKTKFISPPLKKAAFLNNDLKAHWGNKTWAPKTIPKRQVSAFKEAKTLSNNSDFVTSIVDAALLSAHASPVRNGSSLYVFPEFGAEIFLDEIKANLDQKEYAWLMMLLTGNKQLIPKAFTTAAFNKGNFDLFAMLDDVEYEMLNGGICIDEFKRYLRDVLNISDLPYVRTVTDYIKGIA